MGAVDRVGHELGERAVLLAGVPVVIGAIVGIGVHVGIGIHADDVDVGVAGIQAACVVGVVIGGVGIPHDPHAGAVGGARPVHDLVDAPEGPQPVGPALRVGTDIGVARNVHLPARPEHQVVEAVLRPDLDDAGEHAVVLAVGEGLVLRVGRRRAAGDRGHRQADHRNEPARVWRERVRCRFPACVADPGGDRLGVVDIADDQARRRAEGVRQRREVRLERRFVRAAVVVRVAHVGAQREPWRRGVDRLGCHHGGQHDGEHGRAVLVHKRNPPGQGRNQRVAQVHLVSIQTREVSRNRDKRCVCDLMPHNQSSRQGISCFDFDTRCL